MGQSIFGLILLTGVVALVSEKRSAIRPRHVVAGLATQLMLALLLLKLPLFKEFFLLLNRLVLALEDATSAGTSFVFGYLGGGTLPFAETFPGASFVLAFKALPLILVVSALSALLYHWRVIPRVVKLFAIGLQKTMGIGGAAGLCSAANIFVGMVEAPLFIRPYLASLSRSDIFILMTTGMATIAGNMTVIYASLVGSLLPDAMGHILTASIISAPAAIMVALMLVPPDSTTTETDTEIEKPYSSSMDAITRGTTEGIALAINIVAMLVVLVALVSLANMVLGLLPVVGDTPLTLEHIVGWCMAPVAWLMGIPWGEAVHAGSLLGIKIVLNEFLAYMQMAEMGPELLSERSRIIMTYALCGFANFGSLGIMIGGLGSLAPERREEIIGLGFKSIFAGVVATCLTGAVVGILL